MKRKIETKVTIVTQIMSADGVSLFMLVECGDQKKLLEYLNDEGIELSIRNSDDRSPLDVAAILGRGEVAKLLVERGASVNLANKSGYTALHYCASWGKFECLKTMISLGADNRLQNVHKETARDIAERYGKLECAEFLSCVEASRKLTELIQNIKDTLADSDKISGKWGKDDRSKVNALCNEKTDWLDHNNTDINLTDIEEQRKDFDLRIQPYLNKLAQ